MIHRLNVFLLSLIVVFAPVYFTTVYASAAEKWEYEPVMKDMNIHVKGYKVDQYGNAVNDYEYNTKIDPKTTANKQKMGTVGMGRLLKTTGWGLLGSAALEALLQAVDWVIDPAAQSIWRNKKTDPDRDDFTCTYTQDYNGKTYEVDFKDSFADFHRCPLSAAKHRIEYHDTTQNSVVTGSGKFLRWEAPTDFTKGTIYFYASYIYSSGTNEGKTFEVKQSINAARTDRLATQQPEKEYLTADELADYVNKTHKDYADPDLATKLNSKHTPKIVEDLWKPSNSWEEVNSPTVKEAQRRLDQAQPEPKKDAEIKPNPETGGSILPKFCDWAAPVCEAIKWFKESPDLQDEPLNIEDKEVIDYEHINYVQFGSTCPFSPQAQSLPMGVLGSIDFETDLTFICSFGVEAKPYVIGLGHLAALIFLLIGIRNGNG